MGLFVQLSLFFRKEDIISGSLALEIVKTPELENEVENMQIKITMEKNKLYNQYSTEQIYFQHIFSFSTHIIRRIVIMT